MRAHQCPGPQGPRGPPPPRPRPRRAGLSLVVVWSAVASVVAPGTGQPSGLGFFGGGVVRVEVCVCVCVCECGCACLLRVPCQRLLGRAWCCGC